MNERVVSLVPSTTKSLVDLGYRGLLVGATSYCIEPADLHRSLTIVGGTKDPEIDKIIDLKPTLVFANYEENTKESIEQIRSSSPKTEIRLGLSSDIKNTCTEIESITTRLGKTKASLDFQRSFTNQWDKVSAHKKTPQGRQPAIYFIWREPYFVAGTDTYISSVLELAGFENIAGKKRYPEVEWDNVPDGCHLFFTSEPYAFKKRHLFELWSKRSALQKCRFYLADGRDFTWHGTHALHALKKIRQAQESLPHDLYTEVSFS